MAHFDVPGNVLVERGPPEAVSNGMASGIDAFVTKLIVCETTEQAIHLRTVLLILAGSVE